MSIQLMSQNQQVYLLRLWQERGQWHIRVSDLQQGEEYFFTSFEQLNSLLGHEYTLPAHGYACHQNVWGHG